mmetsp:Transcript_17178/g.39681  ORF Transcript_17178/g.39681 Transcript_17178/m.39681 type:complete len:282 (+) Transcript_17178:68-913(+)|eukprot:CAMPEP_0197188590 /NCGR_PEP_ID=MMETSP1423-20130617/18075_1 /TAXON_ID=476441 /ORGANISM="Pseudo-nitzschia heimii, Strain UNC1101" /LENGTH=281 /DNA_ID=CAMNT_0042640465 /DNA_START=12 /DNA_END=857 /DNA_ORIENTATION=-
MSKALQRNSADTDFTLDSHDIPVRGFPKKLSLGKAIKKSVNLLTCVIPSSRSNSSCDGPEDDGMALFNYEMEETHEPDPDLFDLIRFRPWKPEDRAKFDDDAVYWYATLHPRSFSARYDFHHQDGGTLSCFPLVRIVALGATLRTVEAVMLAFPPALVKRQQLRRGTVLHSACAFPSPFQVGVIQFLLEHYPPAVSQTDHGASLPIHKACSAALPIGVEAMQILAEAYPESVLRTNKLGETPLQAARRNPEMLPDVLSYLEEIQREEEERRRYIGDAFECE